MPLFVKESLLFQLFSICVLVPYQQSKTKLFLERFFASIQRSYICTTIDEYLNKKPYFIESVTVKFISRFFDKMHILCQPLARFRETTANGSGFVNFFEKYKPFELKLVLAMFIWGLAFCLFGLEAVGIAIFFAILIYLVLADYQTVTYFLALYPLLDYGIRMVVATMGGIWDELLFLGMVAVWIYKFVAYHKENGFKQTPLDIPIVMFLVAMTLVLLINSPNFTVAVDGYRAMIQYILWFFILLQLLKDHQGGKNICFVFLMVASLMALHGVYQFIIGVEMPSYWQDQAEEGVRTRVFSILTSPNILGSLMTLSLPLCIAFGNIAKSIYGKLLFYAFACTMTLTLVFTFSRGAWIGFAAAVSIYVFFKDKKLFIPVILLGVLAICVVPGISSRIAYMVSPAYIESSLRAGRLIRWITGLQILSEHPVLGVGLGHFGGAVAMNHEMAYLLGGVHEPTYYMDNNYLKIAVETGLFGLTAFVILMYQIFVSGLRTIRITKDKESREIVTGITAGLFGVMIHNFVENVFEVPMMTSVFFMLVAVMMHFWYINYYKN
ncbi:MAG: O-antigen ligase family protein [Bacillota bacterium]